MTQLPLTYPDLLAEEDLDINAAETTSDLQTLKQDVLHILEEPPGSNIDDPDRGIGVVQLLSGSTIPLAALPGIIDGQLTKDDRIDSSQTTLTQEGDGTFTINIQVGVGGAVVGLSYSYSAVSGLRAL